MVGGIGLQEVAGAQGSGVYRSNGISMARKGYGRCPTDEDDLQDIQFLLRAESLTREQLEAAFARARVPDVPEIQELFNRARSAVAQSSRWTWFRCG